MTPSRPLALLLDAVGTLITLRQSVGTTYSASAAGHGIEVGASRHRPGLPDHLHRAPPLAFNGLSGPGPAPGGAGMVGRSDRRLP